MPRVLIISLPINWHNSYPPFVVYYTKKRQDDANLLSTMYEDKGLAKEQERKMSPFYVEGDKN
jgi:hypothetical protein